MNKCLAPLQEASQLSSLLPELKERGVALYGIVHEEKGAKSFNEYLKGEMLFDEEVIIIPMHLEGHNYSTLLVFHCRKCFMAPHRPEVFSVS